MHILLPVAHTCRRTRDPNDLQLNKFHALILGGGGSLDSSPANTIPCRFHGFMGFASHTNPPTAQYIWKREFSDYATYFQSSNVQCWYCRGHTKSMNLYRAFIKKTRGGFRFSNPISYRIRCSVRTLFFIEVPALNSYVTCENVHVYPALPSVNFYSSNVAKS